MIEFFLFFLYVMIYCGIGIGIVVATEEHMGGSGEEKAMITLIVMLFWPAILVAVIVSRFFEALKF